MTEQTDSARCVVTEEFKVTSGEYLMQLLKLWLPRRWVLPVLPVVAAAAVGYVAGDARFYLIALMLVFIVIPMGMSFLYTYYMLTPEARRAILPKRVEVCKGDNIRLVYSEDEYTSQAPEKFPVPEPELISWTDVERVKFTSRYCVYVIKAPRLQFIMIPYTALPAGVSAELLS